MQRSNKTQIPPKRSKTRRGFRQQNNNAKATKAIRAPIAIREVLRPGDMSGRASNGTFVIHNRETFAIVKAPPAGEGENGRYNATSYICNPAVSSIFPWLSGVARHYETYKFRSLVFHYTPQCSTAIAGMVGMCFDLDATDAPPATQMELLANRNAIASSCWGQMDLRVRLEEDRRPTLYTRAISANNSIGDAKTTDLGRFTVTTSGINDGTLAGIVTADYVVELRTPQPPEATGGSFASDGALDRLHLVGDPAGLIYDPNAIVPIFASSSSSFQFMEAFEGLLYMHLVGVNLGNNVQCTVGPTALYGTCTPVQIATSGTETIAVFRLKVSTDAVIMPTANDVTATVTSASWALAPCSYAGMTLVCQ